MNIELPENYWEKEYEKKSALGKYWHGVKYAYRNKMFFRWHRTMIKLWLMVKMMPKGTKKNIK